MDKATYSSLMVDSGENDQDLDGRALKTTTNDATPDQQRPSGFGHLLTKRNIAIGAATMLATLVILAVVLSVCLTRGKSGKHRHRDASRKLPELGCGTSSYQIEGAWKEGGRGVSIWDTFSHTPGKTHDNETGDVATDSYHRYKSDFQFLTLMGARYYRFSLAWPRIVPGGVAGSPVNKEGVDYYNAVIDELLARNITPVTTLYHWDLPQVLQDKYGGWLGDEIVKDFNYYADVCFRAFGGRVKLWATLNEPWTYCMLGYEWGLHAPGLKGGRKASLLAGHHSLLAHAAAVQTFRKYQATQGGRITIVLNSDWAEPLSKSAADKAAAQLRTEFSLAWFADPIHTGDYPPSMRDRLGDLLPRFTPAQSASLKGSIDYFGLNHYTSMYARPSGDKIVPWTEHSSRGRKEIGPQAESEWLRAVPWGFGKLLRWVHERYGSPEIWVMENGASEPGEGSRPLQAGQTEVVDPYRTKYFEGYVAAMEEAVEEGVDVRAYFAWSLLDNFEWSDGYRARFGVIAVDFATQQRVWKQSAGWLRDHFGDLRTRGRLHPVQGRVA